MLIKWHTVPKMFGCFHITSLLLILIINFLLFKPLTKLDNKKLIQSMHVIGLIMVLGEFWKQWFCFNYIMNGQLSLWYLPWQLCSLAMYLAFCLKYMNKSLQNTSLQFLSTFSFVAALAALIYPEDMLRSYVFFTMHGFIYHGLMVTLSMMAIIIVKRKKLYRFHKPVIMFLFTAAIAEIVNVLSNYCFKQFEQPDLFYISPFTTTYQPVFKDIALNYGRMCEIVVYLGSIVLVSYLIFLLIKNDKKVST